MGETMTGDALRWYLVRSKSQQERRVEDNLQAWGVPTLAPKIRELRGSPRSMAARYRVRPLFPDYVFACFDAVQQIAKVRLTRGVQAVIGFGEHATAVDDSVIAMMESRVGEDGYVRIGEPQPGDTVEILSGPLRSFVGVFERGLGPRDRALILLMTMGGARVNVAKAEIRKWGASRYSALAGG